MATASAHKDNVFWVRGSEGITGIVYGKAVVVSKTNPNYSAIEADLKAGRYDRLVKMANVKTFLNDAFDSASNGKLRVKGSKVYWNGPKGEELVRGPLVDRIVATMRDGATEQAVRPLIALLSNISRSPVKDIRDELYDWFMSGKAPITMDGCFLAYKKVRSNFKDIHSGTMDNSPGKLVSQDPSTVDQDRRNVCSRGLHFCSRGYLSHFGSSGGSDRIVIVKVNPRHVYAIPKDYNCQKGRASEYYVVGEFKGNISETEAFLKPFVYDSNVKEAMPEVELAKDVGPSLRPSLKTMAEGYGFSTNGKAFVRTQDTKGPLPTERYTIVFKQGKELISTITGKVVPAEHVTELSIQTKSVRTALVRAVARRRSRG